MSSISLSDEKKLNKTSKCVPYPMLSGNVFMRKTTTAIYDDDQIIPIRFEMN